MARERRGGSVSNDDVALAFSLEGLGVVAPPAKHSNGMLRQLSAGTCRGT